MNLDPRQLPAATCAHTTYTYVTISTNISSTALVQKSDLILVFRKFITKRDVDKNNNYEKKLSKRQPKEYLLLLNKNLYTIFRNTTVAYGTKGGDRFHNETFHISGNNNIIYKQTQSTALGITLLHLLINTHMTTVGFDIQIIYGD